MDYAIKTLEIELLSIENVLRKQRAISCEYMCDHPDSEHYRNSRDEIIEAINVLRKHK